MKKIISLLLIITLVFTLGGCFGEETEKVTPEDVKNRVISEAKEYLKENYPDDEFTYISGRSPNWAYNYYELGFSSKNYDNQEVVVFGTSTDEIVDGKTVYSYYDNYFQYYMKEEAENYFYDTAKEYLGEDIVVKVNFSDSIGFAKAIESSDFYENLQKDNLSVFVNIFTLNSYEKEKQNIYLFLNSFLEKAINISMTYYYVEDITEIENQDIDKVDEDKNYVERKGFYMYDNKIAEYD